MKKIRYTDTRYLNGYTPASQTDISKTFKRVQAEHAAAAKAKAEQEDANEAERQEKLRPMRRGGK